MTTKGVGYGPAYLPQRRRHCVYCRAALVPAQCFPPGVRLPPNVATRDHVFPRRLIPAHAPQRWHERNRVPCCVACNCRKADQHPAEWLRCLPPSTHGDLVARLAALAAFDAARGQQGAAGDRESKGREGEA